MNAIRVRDVARLTFSEPVDWTKTRRRKVSNPRRTPAGYQITVDPRVMEAAKAAMREGERLVIVSAECVRLVPIKEVSK